MVLQAVKSGNTWKASVRISSAQWKNNSNDKHTSGEKHGSKWIFKLCKQTGLYSVIGKVHHHRVWSKMFLS